MALLGCVALSGAACGKDTPTAPSSTVRSALSGTWTGTITDPVAGSARLTLTITETPISANLTGLQGMWSATFPPDVRTTQGALTAIHFTAEERLSINLDPLGLPPCPFSPLPYGMHGNGFVLDVAPGTSRLTGKSTYYTCTESFEGTVDVAR